MSKGNMRRHDRSDVRSLVQLMWKDRYGNEKFTNAYTLDVSESGMRLEVPEQMPERSYVTMRADKLGLHGTASVRSCSRKGTKYVVGLEFSAGLKFKPKPPKTEVKPAELPIETPVVDTPEVPQEAADLESVHR
jgi:hypothetical protein